MDIDRIRSKIELAAANYHVSPTKSTCYTMTSVNLSLIFQSQEDLVDVLLASSKYLLIDRLAIGFPWKMQDGVNHNNPMRAVYL